MSSFSHASHDTFERLRPEADDIVCPSTPDDRHAIGQF